MPRFRSRLFFRRFRPKIFVLFGVLFSTIVVFGFWTNPKVLLRDFIYLVRPIWDKPASQPSIVIPHFYAENLSTAQLCHLHGWTVRTVDEEPSVIDAVIFSTEIDMLEIRLRELWNVVDKFVVIETNLTFTGKDKPLHLAEEMAKFEWAKEKLVYFAVDGLVSTLPKGQTPFYNEIKMRSNMAHVLSSAEVGLKVGDLIIVSDVDEIPSAKTVSLLKSCKGYSSGLHLQMRNYMYSFEFYIDKDNWKPHVDVYKGGRPGYHHQFASNYVLAHAGWHCSFCFRYLDQFVFKMLAYSHTDRVTRDDLLDKNRIQEKICRGADIFDMYPEAYTYRDLIWKMGNLPKTDSAMDVPDFIVQNAERFKFLLPGGCQREDKPQ